MLNQFDNAAGLKREDLTTIRLYANNDPNNVLWEFAFGLRPFPWVRSDEISADAESYEMTVFTPFSEQNNNQTNRYVDLEWKVDNGGVIQTFSTRSTDGLHHNSFDLNTTTNSNAPTEHRVTVKVVASNDPAWEGIIGTETTFGPYRVVPGEVSRIDLRASDSDLPADTLSTATLTATLYDQFNNLVGDGTEVNWAIYGDGALSDQAGLATVNGVASATYQVGSRTSQTEITVAAAEYAQTQIISKSALDLQLQASTTTIEAGSRTPITLTVNVSGSENLSGQTAFFSAGLGKLEQREATLVNGQATVRLIPGTLVGEDKIAVEIIGLQANTSIEYTAGRTEGRVYGEVSQPYIVAASSDGSAAAETIAGTSSFSYTHRTSLTLHGTPGRRYRLFAGGAFTPNQEARVHFTMDQLDEDQGRRVVVDRMSGLNAYVNGGAALETSADGSGTSLAMTGGYLMTQPAAALDATDQFFANMRIKPTELRTEPQYLVRKGGDGENVYTLRLVNINGQLILEGRVATTNGERVVRSVEPVALNNWTMVGLSVESGTVTLALNGRRYSQPLNGAVRGAPVGLLIAQEYRGNIDEIQIGTQTTGGLIAFSADSVTMDGNGRATTEVFATRAVEGGARRVGIAVAPEENLADRQELFIQQPDSGDTQALIATAQRYGMPIAYAYAGDSASPMDGVAVVSPDIFASVSNYFQELEVIGVVVDAAKATGGFLYELTSIHDFEILIKAVIAWKQGREADIDKWEVAFAAVGVIVTVASIFFLPAAGGLTGIKLAMTSFKGFLKHAAQELGLDVIHSLKIVVTELFGTLKRWARKESNAADDMMDAAYVLKELVTGGLTDMRVTFFKVVRAPEDFWTFVKTFKKEAAVVCAVASRQPMPSPVAGLYWDDVIDTAWAAGCFDWTQKLQALARTYDSAVIKHLDEIKANPDFAKKILNENALEGLAETIQVKIKKANGSPDIKNKSEWAQKRIHRMMESFEPKELSDALEGLTALKARTPLPEKYEDFVSSMSYNNNTPFQSVLTLAHLKNANLIGSIKSFETPADLSRLQLGDGFRLPNDWEKESGRRWDVLLENPNRMVEVKGAKHDTQLVDKRFEREGKNDVLHYLFRIDTPPEDFEWVIKTQDGVDGYTKAFEKLLGKKADGTYDDETMDKGLKAVLDHMEDHNIERYNEAKVRLIELRNKLDRHALVIAGSRGN